jgi:hypothetical protein
MDVTKPCEFIGFGAMDVTKPQWIYRVWGHGVKLGSYCFVFLAVAGGCRDELTGYLKAVWPDLLGCLFEVWLAPGAREAPQKCGGLCPPHFGKAFPGPRGRPDLKNASNKFRPDCFQVPSPFGIYRAPIGRQ